MTESQGNELIAAVNDSAVRLAAQGILLSQVVFGLAVLAGLLVLCVVCLGVLAVRSR